MSATLKSSAENDYADPVSLFTRAPEVLRACADFLELADRSRLAWLFGYSLDQADRDRMDALDDWIRRELPTKYTTSSST